MRGGIACLALLSFVIPVMGDEITCTGAFGIDTSEARLIETFGADNLVTSKITVEGRPTVATTTIYPADPARRLVFLWRDAEQMTDLSQVTLPQGTLVPGKLQVGLTIAEVERLNGGPFKLTGFGFANPGFTFFHGEALGDLPGDCLVSAQFAVGNIPSGLDVSSVMTDRDISSDNPLLSQLDVQLAEITLGYAHPDFR